MRIACIHVPQLSLQCAIRVDPALRGAPLVVVGTGVEGRSVLTAPIVVACSRAAWGLGIRLGMTATAARAVAPEVKVVQGDPVIEREAVRAIADALLGVTSAVDLGGRVGSIGSVGAHLAMYAEVPAKTRGTSFGERVLELLEEQGLTGRIGIADDRFTAWVAASAAATTAGERRVDGSTGSSAGEPSVVSVPRGGSAAFLAPRPLSLLAIPPEVQHMLEALGVRTLGEFAALPAPTAARPLEADYQALARGESGSTRALRPYAPEAAIREDIAITAGNALELTDLLPLQERTAGLGGLSAPAAVAIVAQRIARRLSGRGRTAARLEVHALGLEQREIAIGSDGRLETPVDDAEQLARVLAPAIAAAPEGPWRLRVVVAGEAIAGEAAASEAAPSIYAAPTGESSHAAEPAATIDPLAVVLSTSGSLFTLAAPTLRAERREGHLRGKLRRGKQRRSRPASARAPGDRLAQPQLFDRVDRR